MYQLVRLGAGMFGGFRVDEASALESVRHTQVPVLLIHGEDDGTVPCEMAYALRDACVSKVTVLTVPGAGHGISYYVDMASYQKVLLKFIEENMVQ